MAPSATKEPKQSQSVSVSKAGITTSDSGERHIPSSVRPDGTVRKEIRVRPGYRPPEDVEVYKNRTAEAFKNRGKGPIPGSESLTADRDDPASAAAANKNAKRREARKKAAAAAVAAAQEDPKPASNETPKEEPVDPEADKAKAARKLAKKLRQARDLKQKKDDGDALLPEQFDKVIKINELMRQLDKLGFDTDGEKKSDKAESGS